MRSLSGAARDRATENDRPDGRETDHLVGSVIIDIAKLLWPDNTAACFADELGCTVRAAERYLGGHRKLSGDAIAVIVAEIMRRHGARNLKITKR